jgi:uracil-DNA glycosylase
MEEKTKLDWLSFEQLFGTYAPRFKVFFDSGGFDSIYDFLKKESKRGIQISPKSENVFRAFTETPLNNLRVVIVGMCPYHTFYNEEPIADGLCMSCSITKKLQPSLEQWYSACERELGIEGIREPDLKFLAKQGVLLLNAGLTVSKNKAGNMNSLWEPFMKFLFEEVLLTNGIPVVLLGKEASKLKRYIFPFTWIFEVSHPASAQYSGGEWSSENLFTNVNKILKEVSNTNIQWMKTE